MWKEGPGIGGLVRLDSGSEDWEGAEKHFLFSNLSLGENTKSICSHGTFLILYFIKGSNEFN